MTQINAYGALRRPKLPLKAGSHLVLHSPHADEEAPLHNHE